MNKETIIHILELEPNVIDLEKKSSGLQPLYILKEYIQCGDQKVSTGNYYTMEQLVRSLRSKTSNNVDTSIQSASYDVAKNLDVTFEYNFNRRCNLQATVSREKRIQKLQVIVPNKIEKSAEDNKDLELFGEALAGIVGKVRKRNERYKKIKLQKKAKGHRRAVGVLSFTIGISIGAVTIAGASNYILEQQKKQREESYMDWKKYNSLGPSPEHGSLYSAQEILERYELEQQYLEEQQNDFEEGKTR